MTETVTCPAKGCDYSGVKSSVLGHYSGKRDDAHAGGYEHAKSKLSGESTAEATDSGRQTAGDSGGGGDGAGGNPVFGSADPDGDDVDESNDAVVLPCGCESYHPEEAPDTDKRVVVTCSQCGKKYKVKE